LDENSRKALKGLKEAWIKGSDEDEIFRGSFCGRVKAVT
jgi:hypothetical protein